MLARCLVFALAVGALGIAAPLAAAPTPEQRRELTLLETNLTKAGNLYKQGKIQESAEAIREAQGRFEKLAKQADAELVKALQPALARLQKAHEILAVEGIELPALPELVAAEPAPKPQPMAPPQPGAPAPAAGTGVSFVRQVAPMLVAKCGRCHVGDSKGMFSMANYEVLMQGPRGNRVIFPGDAGDSHIIKVIEEGDMPRGGLKVTPAELDTLKKWIAEGAKFDGQDQKANLGTLASATNPAPMPAAPVVVAKATGKETVSFSRDVAPALAGSCLGCHGNQQPRARFNLTTFEGLLKGGESGPNILPGKPSESLLVQKLKGQAGDRMPLNLPPLSDETIAKIEKWIAEGAKFDGDSPTLPIKRIADLAIAKHATHEELAEKRVESADRSWRLAMADIQGEKVTTTNFHLVGNVGPNTLKQIADKAEEELAKLVALWKLSGEQPPIKGKLTIFVFANRYDYGEFGKMVEGRTLPSTWRGHFKFDVVNAYAAVLPSQTNDYSTNTLLAQEIASAYVASLGDVPDWFAEGYGRVTAARLDAKDKRVAAWDAELPAALQSMGAPDDFILGKSSPEVAALAAYSFVKYLMADARRTGALLDSIRGGDSFDAAFTKAYGGTPSQRALDWAKKPISAPRGR